MDIFIKCLNKKSETIISIFSGRMADVGKDPIPIIRQSVKLAKKFKKVKILWASTREAYNYTEALKCGCQIITMPPKIIYQISKFGKSFNELTIDTVKNFYKDALKATPCMPLPSLSPAAIAETWVPCLFSSVVGDRV